LQAQGIGYDSQVMAGRFSSLDPDFKALVHLEIEGDNAGHGAKVRTPIQ
jgi:hypothetical protein